MKKFAVAAALLSAVVATPALAQNGEGHVEVRGGYITGSGLDDATLGVAGGYDYNLGDKAFAGVEIAGDGLFRNADGEAQVRRVGGRFGKGPAVWPAFVLDGLPDRRTTDSRHALGAADTTVRRREWYHELSGGRRGEE